jgi:hypothetical protein
MGIKLQDLWQKIRGEGGAAPDPQLSHAEQTRRSWARALDSYAAIPGPYRDFFAPLQEAGRPFPYAVLTPTYEGFLHRAAEKLICDLGSEIAVLERSGGTCQVQCYPLAGISRVQVQTVLLYSRITISGRNRQGVHACSSVRFNTVTDYLFTPIVVKMRPAGPAQPGAGPEVFADWATISFKLMNYARHSLLAGETVLQAILQPEIRTAVFRALGRTFFRTLSPAHATILTDRELITIREEQRLGGEERYGGTWDYIPLSQVVDLSTRSQEDGLLAWTVQLPGDERIELLFQAAARPQLDRLGAAGH